MFRTALFFCVVTATLAAEIDPNSSKEFVKRELSESDKLVIKVSVGQHTSIATDAVIVDTEVTRREQYLVWGDTEGRPRRLYDWKMDAARQWLVSTEGNELMAYDLVGGFMVPIQTRLPVEALLGMSDRATGEVTVRLIDRTVEKYSMGKRTKP